MKGKIGFGFRCEYACGGKAVVVDQGGVVAAYPVDGIGRIGDDGIKGFAVFEFGVGQRVAQFDVEFVVIDVVQKHIHAGEVVGGVVDFLPEEAFFDDVFVKLFFRLQEQAARAAGGVVDFVDFLLPVHRQPRNQLGDALRGEKFAAGFACVGGVVGNQVFVGITEKVDAVVFKIAEIEFRHAFKDGGKAFVFVGNGAAEPAAGGVEVVKQAFDALFGCSDG